MSLMDEISKEIGESDANQGVSDWLTTGILPLNKALSGRFDGGFPVGRISEVYGAESCLAADTFIPYEVHDESGRRQNSKGGTIERLYCRFHRIPIAGKGSYQRPSTKNSTFHISSVTDDGFVVMNRVCDVVKTGTKECFKLATTGGHEIEATENHKFWNGDRFVKVGDMKVGDTVFVNNGTHYKADDPAPNAGRREWLVKNHPTESIKVVKGKYIYKRINVGRAAYEAHMNGLDPDEYRDRLNSGTLDGLQFLDSDKHVHHLDEDCENNDIENLVVIDPSYHGKIHASDRAGNLSFVAVPDTVASIVPCGERPTYDVKMAAPLNNYIANKFVVHNCGKTLLATMAMIETQRKGGVAAMMDFEHAFSIDRAVQLGLEPVAEKWIYKQPTTAEQGFVMAQKICEIMQKHAPDRHLTIVFDSIASMVTEDELKAGFIDGNMKTRLSLAVCMSSSLKILTGIVSKTNSTLIFLNQVRDNPGVLFGDKEVTPGGKAMKFYASLRVRLRKGEKIKAEDGDITGEKITATTIKNKVHRPFVDCLYISSFTEGVDLYETHVQALEEAGKLGNTKGWVEFDGKKMRRKELITQARADAETYQRLLNLFAGEVEP